MKNNLAFDLYELTMAQVYFKYAPDTQATFDLFIRSPKRQFYIAAGIDEALNFLQDLKFSKKDIEYLAGLKLFDPEFLSYLKKFKFQGTVWAMEEPEIVFASEPIMRVTSNLIEAQIVESFLLNSVNCATTLATKAARVVIAAKGKDVFDFALRRTQGLEASLACARYSYMCGAGGTSNVSAGSVYGIPVVGTMAHSYVMTFEREIESFLYFSQEFPKKSILLVDTYDVEKGIDAAIRAGTFLKKKGIEITGLRLDSGDLAKDGRKARLKLDMEGFIDTGLVASGDLNEYKIQDLISAHAPFDSFGVGTNMGCSSDLPYTDVIYKLVEIKNKTKSFLPTMKLSEGKVTYPGRKQVFRFFDQDKIMQKDMIALDKEKAGGKKLLKKVFDKGKRVLQEKSLKTKRRLFFEKSMLLPEYLKQFDTKDHYPVEVSKELLSLTKNLAEEIKRRIQTKTVFIDVDCQTDFLSKTGALFVKGSEKVSANAAKLTNFARKQGILIISTQDTHSKNDPEFREFPPHCVKGTKGCKKIKTTLLKNNKTLSMKKKYDFDDLKKTAEKYEQLIIEKPTYSAFANPNLKPLIEAVFPDQIFIYGVVTEFCVKEMVEGLLKQNYRISLVTDAVKELSASERDELYDSWKKRGVQFVKTADILSNKI